MQSNLSILFFGSGPVAAASLRYLSGIFAIEAIITKPATFEEMRLVLPGTPVFGADNRHQLNGIFQTHRFVSKLGVLVDFGVIVGQQIIDAFPLGIINSHFSLLPEWRGADPITFAILSGQHKTGVSIMLLTKAMDEGPLLAQATYDIRHDETTPSLTGALIDLSNRTLASVVPAYTKGNIEPQDQLKVTLAPTRIPSYSHKLDKGDGIIDWQKPATQLEREIRAFIQWPRSRTTLADREVVITKAAVVALSAKPGVISHDNNKLIVGCGSDSLEILRLIPAGKPEMAAAAFLAGYRQYLSM